MPTDASYPDQARYVSRVCAALGLSFVDLDHGRGYLFEVSDGRHRFVSGAGRICAYPLNSAAAYTVSRDKWHTNSVLRRADIPVIPGSLYFVTDDHAKLRAPGRELADAIRAFPGLAAPVFCKPNNGSRGDFAEIVPDSVAFLDYVERVRRNHDAILIQPVMDGDEHRVFCIDDEAVFAAQKSRMSLTGDGARTLAQLIEEQNAALAGTGISPLPAKNALAYLAAQGLPPGHVPDSGERIELPGRRNLSAGNDLLSFSTTVPPPLAELALRAARAIGIRVSGVDIFDTSPARNLSGLTVIEINGNPALSSLSRIGRDDVVDLIWRKVLLKYFAERTG